MEDTDNPFDNPFAFNGGPIYCNQKFWRRSRKALSSRESYLLLDGPLVPGLSPNVGPRTDAERQHPFTYPADSAPTHRATAVAALRHLMSELKATRERCYIAEWVPGQSVPAGDPSPTSWGSDLRVKQWTDQIYELDAQLDNISQLPMISQQYISDTRWMLNSTMKTAFRVADLTELASIAAIAAPDQEKDHLLSLARRAAEENYKVALEARDAYMQDSSEEEEEEEEDPEKKKDWQRRCDEEFAKEDPDNLTEENTCPVCYCREATCVIDCQGRHRFCPLCAEGQTEHVGDGRCPMCRQGFSGYQCMKKLACQCVGQALERCGADHKKDTAQP